MYSVVKEKINRRTHRMTQKKKKLMLYTQWLDMKCDTNELQERVRVKWILFSVVGTLCVLCLTHIPQAAIKVNLTLLNSDKVIHAVVYGVLAFLYVMSAASQGNGLVLIGIVMILGSIAGLDEWSQSFVGRSCSVMDFVADMIGIVAVVLTKRLIFSGDRTLRNPS